MDTDEVCAGKLSVALRAFGFVKLATATFETDPMQWAEDCEPELVLTAYRSPTHDGPGFVKAMRRSSLPCRRAPVIMTNNLSTRDILAEARNSGADELVLTPFKDEELFERILHVIDKPRPWIEAMTYVGPDRRRFNSGQFSGPSKRGARRVVGHLVDVEQSVRILKSAIEHFDLDRHQALRSIMAQLPVLVANSKVLSDQKFTSGVVELLALVKSPETTGDSLMPVLSRLMRAIGMQA